MKPLTLTIALLACQACYACAGEPILLDFTASWCGPCQSMRPIVRKLKAEGVDVREVDCSNGIPHAQSGFGVKAFPTFLVWQDGRVIQRQVGACSIETLRAMLVPVTVNYQAPPNQETSWRLPGAPPASFKSGMVVFAPVAQSPPGLSPTHSEIMKYVPPGKSRREKYEPQGAVTWAHEDVHVIHEQWSRQMGPGIWAFYMADGNAIALRAPNISKTIVEQMMPDTLKRGKSWGLYMTGSNPDHPFVILDEWVAYIVSAQVANELYGAAETRVKSVSRSGPVTDTLSEVIIDRSNAVDFAGYATILLRCVERFDPDYPDMDTLREFVSVNIQRTLDVQMTPVTVAYQRYFQQFNPKCYQPQGRIQPGRVEAVIHPPTLEPIPPKPQQPAKPCNCETRIAALELRIKELEFRKPLKGDKGEPGVAGKQGPAGPQGAPGKDAQPPAIDAIAAEVIKQIPANTLELWEDGKLVDSLPVPVGGRIPITRESIKVK
jgi:thioredoxin 1